MVSVKRSNFCAIQVGSVEAATQTDAAVDSVRGTSEAASQGRSRWRGAGLSRREKRTQRLQRLQVLSPHRRSAVPVAQAHELHV